MTTLKNMILSESMKYLNYDSSKNMKWEKGNLFFQTPEHLSNGEAWLPSGCDLDTEWLLQIILEVVFQYPGYNSSEVVLHHAGDVQELSGVPVVHDRQLLQQLLTHSVGGDGGEVPTNTGDRVVLGRVLPVSLVAGYRRRERVRKEREKSNLMSYFAQVYIL